MMTRVAVIGCGYWGRNLVRVFRQLGALDTVCDPSEIGRATARQLAPDARVTADVDAVLADAAIDAVVIATPAETHHRIAVAALRAGKDVFVEKPLALRYADGLDIVRVADEQQRILFVGHVLEYHPAIVRLRELIDQGELGALQYLYSNRLSFGKIRREENILWSFAPHDIAVILRLVGAAPTDVASTGGAYLQAGIADVTVTNLRFASGVGAHIHVSWLHPYKEQRLVVIGTHKMASFDDVNKQLLLYDQRVDWQDGNPVPIRSAGVAVPFADDEPLRRECAAFLDAVATRVTPLTDGASGARVLQVLHAAGESLRRGGTVVPLAGVIPQERS
jgi:predicted dehydrogenase